MTARQDGTSLTAASRQPAHGSVQTLHQAASRFAELRRGAPFRTRELVSLLLGHAARSWRASLPPVVVGLRVNSPDGQPAVRIRLP